MAHTDSALELDRETPFLINDWRVEPASGRLIRGEQEIKLEPRVMDLLLCLAARPGEVLTRETLEASVWTGMVVGYDALTSAMIKLRKAFDDDSRHPQIIETVAKRGYRLIAPVSYPSPATTEYETEATGSGATPSPDTQHTSKAYYAATVVALIIILTAGYLHFGNRDETSLPASVQEAAQAGIIVLPFINLNDDPAQEYFSDGISEDLIIDLSRFSNLFVVSRRLAFMYKRHSADIRTMAKDLGVGYVVEGSVRRNGNELRINVQLVDAATGINLWAERFDRHTADLFSVQDEMRRNIINALSITLTEEEHKREQRRYTSSFEAYDLFLQGQARLVTRASALDSQKAQELMEQAIRLDPGFARAHAALALIHADAYRFDWSDNPEHTRQEALQIGKRAIELDNQSPQAHWILGYIYLFLFEDHGKAINLAKRAIELAPHDNDGFNLLAVTYSFGEEPAKARLIILELMKKNPRYSSMVPGVLAHANLFLGDYTAALDAYHESLMINPSRINALVYKSLTLYRMGRIDDASFQIDELYTLHPNFNFKTWAARQPFKDKIIEKQIVDDLIRAGMRSD